ncbi:MAG: c-type cytochrome biogenesis protein CcmI [Alphaproteobacteria bacterium]
MIWLAVGLMTLSAIGLLAWPVLRRRAAPPPREAYDLAVYRDQLAELDRDLARGVISAAEAEGARLEIQRRMLKLAPRQEAASPDAAPLPKPPGRTARRLAPLGALGLALPALAIALYVSIGSPDLPSRPFGAAEREAGVSHADVEAAIERLEARLERQPDDLDGWVTLGRSYIVLNRYGEAVDALKRAAALSDNDPDLVASLAEAMVFDAGGAVTPEARRLFASVEAARPDDPAALYYIGMADAQGGDPAAALETWERLAALTPPDAPWRADLIAMMTQAAAELGVEPKLPPGPGTEDKPPQVGAADRGQNQQTPPQVGAADRGQNQQSGEADRGQQDNNNLSAEERQAMIEGMVERLAERLKENPDDLEGWKRLALSYRVLGDWAKALPAYARAAALAPEDAAAQAEYARAMLDAAPSRERVPEEAISLYRRVLALDPDHADALWFVGYAEATAEPPDREAARGHWSKLLSVLPPGSEAYQSVEKALDAL